MCGLAGFWGGCFESVEAKSILDRMGMAIKSRGPDDAGCWYDPNVGIGLSHRRLSIVDLSAAGHQPMVSHSARYVIVFNGEIYNHLEIRRELEKQKGLLPPWRGHSDTETLLAGIETWGLEKTLRRTVGMFAMAVWDRETRELNLARDRFGEKPLYYGYQKGVLLFGSELKALRVHPAFSAQIDRSSLSMYLRHNYVPTPFSIYSGIHKLSPGTRLAITEKELREQVFSDPIHYWSMHNAMEYGSKNPFKGSEQEGIEEFERTLKYAVKQQQVADVPLGAFLSGGVDSSTIVALMQAQSVRAVKTFTIGFYEKGFNEAEHAKAVAQHLGTDHTELYVTPQQALDVIPKIPALYDEPFADSSQIPTYLVAELARGHVTVALSGDAGDELLGGYNRYLLARSIWNKMSVVPLSVRKVIARAITIPSSQAWDKTLDLVNKLTKGRIRFVHAGDKLHKLSEVLAVDCPHDIYLQLVSHWKDPDSVVLGGHEYPSILSNKQCWPQTNDFEHWMMAMDTSTYLVDDILTKVDRAAMGVSLETRVPLLDHRVAELAWRMPLSMKIRNGTSKWLLRQVLYKYVPREMIERPKMGFGVPIDVWLRGPLREWADALLAENKLHQEGYFVVAPIRKMWTEHLKGQRNWQYYLWDVLMFQAWLEFNKNL